MVHTETAPPLEDLYARTLLEIGIPPRPAVLDVLAGEMRRDEPDFNHIAHSVAEDVSLSAGLIKTANSPFFGFRIRARSIPHALSMLGMDSASKAIAGVALRNAFPPSPAMERFWDASCKIAEYCGYLAGVLGARDLVSIDDAYTFGLFRDCGIPVLLRKFPGYRDTLAHANADTEHRFTSIEDADLPTNHAIVGCLLAQSWSLPEEICLAIRHHHDYLLMQTCASSLPPASRRLIALAQVAEYIHQQHSGLYPSQEWRKLGDACLATLGLAESDLPALVGQIIAASDHLPAD